MAKFAVLFVAFLTFHAALARITSNQQSQWISGLMKKMEQNTNEALNLIQSAPMNNRQATRALDSQINEWVHKIQKANHHLETALEHNQAGLGSEASDQIVLRLSNITHSMRQALIGDDHNQKKNRFKTHLQDVLTETQKLSQVAQQHLQKEQENQDNIWEELEDVMEELSDATSQLKINRKLQAANQQEIKSKVQSIIGEVVNTIQSISSNDEATAHKLAHQIHELSHRLERIIHVLRRDAHNRLEGETRNIIMEISDKLIEIRVVLDQVITSEQKTVWITWIPEMKNQLKSNINNIAVQMERLLQLLKTGRETNQVIATNNLIRNVLADALSEARRLQWQLENIN